MSKANIAPCGINCRECEWQKGKKQPYCAGCIEIKGKPFWGACKTYTCSSSKGVEHCGVCGEFPCDQFTELYDPNNPEGQRDAVYRIGILAYRAKHSDEKTAELIKKTAKNH